MSDDFINCGACGDKRRYDEQHDCWVIQKYQSQENVLETCPVCFEDIRAPHWRCDDRQIEAGLSVPLGMLDVQS